MKNILFVGGYPPPYGGIANHLYTLLPELLAKGYRVSTQTLSSENKVLMSEKMTNTYFDLMSFVKSNLLLVFLDFFRFLNYKSELSFREYVRAIALARYISLSVKKEKYDIVFLYSIDAGLCASFLKRILPNLPINLMIFGDFYKSKDLYLKKTNILTSTFDSCNNILASSCYCGKSIKYILNKNYDFKVVFIGVDTEMYSPNNVINSDKMDFTLPSNAIVLMYFARMIKLMGAGLLLDVIEDLLKIDKNVHIVLAGAEGDYSEKFKALSKNNSRIIYKPNVPFEQKLYYFKKMDILLAPTLEFQACMGVSIKEAMACGKPIIASNSGGIPEAIKDGIHGFIIPIENGEINKLLMINKIRELIQNSSLRSEMGKNGRNRALKLFTIASTVEKYIQIIENNN
tara:strand:- start:749 stop:1951 length:1203 start_codon:yes stop_codon:yes gene_type:complete